MTRDAGGFLTKEYLLAKQLYRKLEQKGGMLLNNRLEGFENFGDSLMKLRLIGIALFNCFHKICKILILKSHF